LIIYIHHLTQVKIANIFSKFIMREHFWNHNIGPWSTPSTSGMTVGSISWSTEVVPWCSSSEEIPIRRSCQHCSTIDYTRHPPPKKNGNY
jgi:hypothetical protein